MKDSRWDIKTTFKQDLEYGHMGENFVHNVLSSMGSDAVEVKSDRYRNGKMVVETSQNPRLTGWVPSGISVTQAKWWAYVYSMNTAVLIISVERLKRFLETLDDTRITTFAKNTSNPARGYLLLPSEVSDLVASSKYDG